MKDNQTATYVTGKADPNWKIGIVASSFYPEIMEELIKSATECLLEAGIQNENIKRVNAPGSFEVPLLGAVLAENKSVDAIIGLGVIVKGETHHAKLLAKQSARGIMNVQLKYRIPFAFEILFVDSIAQAEERSKKGREAANSVLISLEAIHKIKI